MINSHNKEYINKEYITLKQLLADIIKTIEEVMKSEESLQDMIIKGDFRWIAETQEHRDMLQAKLTAMEEKRTAIIPEGHSIREYIDRVASDIKTKEELWELLNNVSENLHQMKLLNSLNRDLLRERVRFLKEMRQVLLGEDSSYTAMGKVLSANEGEAIKINRTC